MLKFHFLEKGLRIVSPLHFVYDFVYDFFKKNLRPNFWLPLLLEKLGNGCIVIICYSGCDVRNSEINFTFLIKSFSFVTKNSRQTFNYLQNEKTFKVKQKAFFIIFKGISLTKNCLWPESAPLKYKLDPRFERLNLPFFSYWQQK